MYIDTLTFKISDIKCGWIFAVIETETGEMVLSNSYLGGLQMPKIFLKAMSELLSNHEHEKWLSWYGESNSYIWHLIIKNELLELVICDLDSSLVLPLEGKALSKYLVPSKTLLKVNASLLLFAQSVCEAFKFYSFGEGYDIWQNSKYKDRFPREELSRLRKILRRTDII